ncbi:MAG: universal stress protein [Pseudomonadota bacterium]
MEGCRKILIAVNGHIDVLARGLKVISDEECWVTVVKVIPPYEGDLSLVGVKNITEVLNGNYKNTVSQMRELGKIDGRFLKIQVKSGEIEKKIVETAKENRCDLLIMGKPKPSMIKKLLCCDIVENVSNQVSCPVLLV